MIAKKQLHFWVRPATEADFDACRSLDHSSSSDYVWQVEVREQQGQFMYSFRSVRLPREMVVTQPQNPSFSRELWDSRNFLVVAEGGEGIFGYLGMQTDPVYSIGWIREIVVDRSRRRHRIGSALLNEAQKWARAHDLARVTVETQTKNYPAIQFCQRHGLSFCGFNDRYYPNQDIALFFTQSLR
jgi:GNAT superfamily N-acetyltransferase